jgi:hypothetical protein
MHITLKKLNVRYRQKLGIPHAKSYACFEITTVPTWCLINQNLIFLQTIPKLKAMGDLRRENIPFRSIAKTRGILSRRRLF